jgi:hypothetical protein
LFLLWGRALASWSLAMDEHRGTRSSGYQQLNVEVVL